MSSPCSSTRACAPATEQPPAGSQITTPGAYSCSAQLSAHFVISLSIARSPHTLTESSADSAAVPKAAMVGAICAGDLRCPLGRRVLLISSCPSSMPERLVTFRPRMAMLCAHQESLRWYLRATRNPQLPGLAAGAVTSEGTHQVLVWDAGVVWPAHCRSVWLLIWAHQELRVVSLESC